jgi:hypothetical protein
MNQRMLLQAMACLALLVAVYGPPQTAKRFYGQVVFTSDNRLVLFVGGQDLRFFRYGDARVTVDGKPAMLSAIQA